MTVLIDIEFVNACDLPLVSDETEFLPLHV